MTKVSGHVFWYADEKPDTFAQALHQILLDSLPVNWTVVDQRGIQKFRTGVRPSKHADTLREAWQQGFISLTAHATLSDGKTRTAYGPSPLSVQYAPFCDDVVYPPNATHDQISLYRSLHSVSTYVNGRGLSECPHLLQLELSRESEQLEPREQTQTLANAMLSIPTCEGFRWLAVLDASPEIRLNMGAMSLLGHAPPLTDRLDRYMYTPSYLTMGSQRIVAQYRDSVVTNFPNELFEYREQGHSAYLLFDDMASTKRVYMPAWHERPVINWPPQVFAKP